MASNENPLGPSPLALRALQEAAPRLHIYPESSAPTLRSALSAKYGVDPDSIILGNGSDEIMAFACHIFLGEGAEAVMVENTFSMYRICAQAFGGSVVQVPLRHGRYDFDALAKTVTPRTRILFLAVPNSPTGLSVSHEEFDAFLEALPRRGLLLVIDEAYREYVVDPDCPECLDYLKSDRLTLVLRTFSKIYGLAGLRVGYGFTAPWLVELMNRVRPPFNVNAAAQAAATAALEDTRHLERSLKNTRDGLAYLEKELTNLGLTFFPSQANFLCFSVGPDARRVYEGLLQKGIIVRHLASFGMENHIRVTVGAPDENRRFIQALKRTMSELRR
jgi:histidinol-phosphate aminotransferase